MESRIQALVAAGAEEATVRDLVRDAVVLATIGPRRTGSRRAPRRHADA